MGANISHDLLSVAQDHVDSAEKPPAPLLRLAALVHHFRSFVREAQKQ